MRSYAIAWLRGCSPAALRQVLSSSLWIESLVDGLAPDDEVLGFGEFLDGEERLRWMALNLTFEVQGLNESMLEPPELMVPCWR